MKEKTFLKLGFVAVITWLAMLICHGQTNVIFGYEGDLTGQPPTYRSTATIYCLSPNPRTIGNITVQQQAISCQVNITNGYYSFTNVPFGYYSLTLTSVQGTTFYFWVGLQNTGFVPIASLIQNVQALPPDPGTNYYTQAQVDALLANVSGSANITNGLNTTISTNGSGAIAVNVATNAFDTNGAAAAATNSTGTIAAGLGIFSTAIATNLTLANLGNNPTITAQGFGGWSSTIAFANGGDFFSEPVNVTGDIQATTYISGGSYITEAGTNFNIAATGNGIVGGVGMTNGVITGIGSGLTGIPSATNATYSGTATNASGTGTAMTTNDSRAVTLSSLTATGTFNGNGGGLLGGSNSIYYFDPYATNTVSQPNNPLTPYHSLDSINTMALTSPATFILASGVYYFTNSITNASVLGSGLANTILVDGNTNGGNGGATEQIASAFTVSTNNLVWRDFTIGFSDGGPNDITNYNSVWWASSGSTCTNEFCANINYPLNLPFGITGGSSFDGWYDNSSGSAGWTFNNVSGDVPWDWNVRTSASSGALNLTWINCQQTTEAYTNSSNPSGAGHFFYDSAVENNSVYKWIGCTLRCNGAFTPNVIQITGAQITNCSVFLQGTSISTANNTNDFYLTGKSTATNLVLNISGSSLDQNWLQSNSSAVWKNAVQYSFLDPYGLSHLSGSLFIQTNTSIIAPAPFINGGMLWNSNNALYWVTSTHTNYVSGP